MLITKEIEIDLGHRVSNHKSKCSSLHGHRYKIEVGVDDKVIEAQGESNEGMVIDFGDLKQIMVDVLDKRFDHGFILWSGDQMCNALRNDFKTKYTEVSFIPTAENLARYWYELIEVELKKVGIKIKHVKVWETPTSTATYTDINDWKTFPIARQKDEE